MKANILLLQNKVFLSKKNSQNREVKQAYIFRDIWSNTVDQLKFGSTTFREIFEKNQQFSEFAKSWIWVSESARN